MGEMPGSNERRVRAAASDCKWYSLSVTFNSSPPEAIYWYPVENQTRGKLLYATGGACPV
jgi:hypothetical protein